MGNNTCACQSPSDDPEYKCCPDSIESASAIDVRDKTCKMRRLLAEINGIIASVNGKFILSDGSEALPIFLNVETVDSSSGAALVQDTNGRILAVIPDESLATLNPTLTFVYQDGVMKFVPVVNEITLDDDATPEVATGVLATFSCAADGRIQIAKLVPDCIVEEGEIRALVIGGDGKVTCAPDAYGDCLANVEDVEEADAVLVCLAGKQVPILPVKGKFLKGVGDDPDTKWELVDAVSGMHLEEPYIFVGQKHAGPNRLPSMSGIVDIPSPTSGSTSGSYDMTGISGYIPGSTIAWVRLCTLVDVVIGGEAKAQVKLNSIVRLESWIDTADTFGYKNDAPAVPVKLTADAFTFELIAESGGGSALAWCQLQICGWE